jgi:hypothetical protein
MTKSRKNQQKSTVMIVDQGANWRIERERGASDYLAYVDGRGYIGYRPTATAARMLIAEYNCPEVS